MIDLKRRLEQHRLWLDGDPAGVRFNLRDADLRSADLRSANLRGAYLGSLTIIDAGQDLRGYRFVAVQWPDWLRIAAGCRWFTLNEALAHWGAGSKSKNAEECLRKVEMIEAEARRRGWLG